MMATARDSSLTTERAPSVVARAIGTLPELTGRTITLAVLLLVLGGTVKVTAAQEWTVPATDNVYEAVRWVATRQVHGWVDDHLSMTDLSQKAVDQPLYITCGTVALWTVDRLAEAGYEARVVMAMNWGEWDGWENGHTFIEARTDDGWVAFDVDRKVRWTRDGQPLSLLEWMNGPYEIVPIIIPVLDKPFMLEQDARWSEVPFIEENGLYWFPSGPWDADMLAYDPAYRVMDPAEWLARFYG